MGGVSNAAGLGSVQPSQQPQYNQQSLGGMNGPLGGMPQNGITPFMGGMSGPLGATPYNSGTPSYSIGGQTFGGAIGSSPYSAANPQMTGGQPTQSTGLNPSFLNLNEQSLNPVGQMTNNVNQQRPQVLPMQTQPMQQMPQMGQQATQTLNQMQRPQVLPQMQPQGGMINYGNPMPQQYQRGFEHQMPRFDQSRFNNFNRPNDNRRYEQEGRSNMMNQMRLAKALRGD